LSRSRCDGKRHLQQHSGHIKRILIGVRAGF